MECKVCSLTLVSAPHLARSYHHLFPLEAFKEVPITPSVNFATQKQPPSVNDSTPAKTLSSTSSSSNVPNNCFSCQCSLQTEKAAYRCAKCAATFCTDCDLFIHESLHTCPKCACSRDQLFRGGGAGKIAGKKGR